MDEYPEELRTPPVSLVALVGCSEVHSTISACLHKEQPPTNTLALPDFSKVSMLAKSEGPSSESCLDGILKREWLHKHRTRVPAVVSVFFHAEDVFGDPTQWHDVIAHIDSTKVIISGRNIKLMIVIVQLKSSDKINEDGVIALSRRAEVDPKYVLVFIPDEASELKRSLARIRGTFTELTDSYYKDEGRRIKSLIERKSFSSVDLNIRYCFKVAVYAEFRRDWPEALKFYEEGYHILHEVVGDEEVASIVQRMVEIKCVAEQFNFKISTLLLHAGRLVEALTWFRQHISSYRQLVGPASVAFLHWEWMSRQLLAFAELMEAASSSAVTATFSHPALSTAAVPLTDPEMLPAYYYQLAAHYLLKKKTSLGLLPSHSEGSGSGSIVPSVYVGRYERMLDDGITLQLLGDEEYSQFLVSEGRRYSDSYEIIAILHKAFEMYSGLNFHRMASHCASTIAAEYSDLRDFINARQFLESVAVSYREEGWLALLWDALAGLRECSRHDGNVVNQVEYSLEMAALPLPSLTQATREEIQRETFEIINGGEKDEDGACSPLHLEIDLVSPLRIVLLSSASFHDQSSKLGVPVGFSLGLLSHLPTTVHIDRLEVEFNQLTCNFTTDGHDLVSNKWLRLSHDVVPGNSGKLECVSVIATIGTCLTIRCTVESPSSILDLPLWKFENLSDNRTPTGQKTVQVEEPDPAVSLTVASDGPAFVGENFPVHITVRSDSRDVHSGELKINLIDTDTSSAATVELVTINSGTIRKIQSSSVLISIPFIAEADSSTCRLDVRFQRPDAVTVYVSFGYSHPLSSKVNLHRSLRIEAITAMAISHRLMMPCRRHALVMSPRGLPLGEPALLVVAVENCSDVPLQLYSLLVMPGPGHVDPVVLPPREEFRRVFPVGSPGVPLGTVEVRWGRLLPGSETVLTTETLPGAVVDPSPLIVRLDFPHRAVVGMPFTYAVCVRNRTSLLQEVAVALPDSQSFVFSGSHGDGVCVLPNAEHVVRYRLVALASGILVLPRITLTSTRYGAEFQPSVAAASVFVFPSPPPSLVSFAA